MKIFQSSTSNFADGKRPSLKPSHFVGLNCVSWDLRSSLWSWLIKITFFHRFEWFSISFMAKKDIFFMTKLFLFLRNLTSKHVISHHFRFDDISCYQHDLGMVQVHVSKWRKNGFISSIYFFFFAWNVPNGNGIPLKMVINHSVEIQKNHFRAIFFPSKNK